MGQVSPREVICLILFLMLTLIAYCVAGTCDYQDRVNSLSDNLPDESWLNGGIND